MATLLPVWPISVGRSRRSFAWGHDGGSLGPPIPRTPPAVLTDLSVRQFLDRCGAREPVPGGGSVAALLLALGASMGEMAGRYSLGREGAEAAEELVAALAGLRERGLQLVDQDAEGFAAVGAAYALARKTDEQKATRKAAITAALALALGPPRQMVAAASAGSALLERLLPLANPNLISDVGVAAHALAAAARCAWLNVVVNLGGVPEGEARDAVRAEGAAALASVDRVERSLGAAVLARLSA